MADVNAIYYGEIDDMIAEVGVFDFRTINVPARKCKYIVMPWGDAQHDSGYFATLTDAQNEATWLAKLYDCKAYRV